MLQTLSVSTITPSQKRARNSQHRAIDQLKNGGVSGMVPGTPLSNTLAVRSFYDENHFYNIELDFSNRELISLVAHILIFINQGWSANTSH
jgi:hypothetical protein